MSAAPISPQARRDLERAFLRILRLRHPDRVWTIEKPSRDTGTRAAPAVTSSLEEWS